MAKEIIDLLYGFNTRADITIESLADIISDIAVPVVRCKNCKHASEEENWWKDGFLYCDYFEMCLDKDFFCAFGKRKEDGSDR